MEIIIMENDIEDSPQVRFIKFIEKQRKDIKAFKLYDKMYYDDMKRIHMIMGSVDIFGDECVVYDGKFKKNNYIVLSFNGKKVSLLKLLYLNYVDDLDNDAKYVSFCNNKGLCMCLNHFTYKSRRYTI
jgi:hypothetical protein